MNTRMPTTLAYCLAQFAPPSGEMHKIVSEDRARQIDRAMHADKLADGYVRRNEARAFDLQCRHQNIAGYSTLGSIVLAGAFAALLGWFGPSIDDHSDERAQADSLADAIKSEAAEDRFERAARQICGENAGFKRGDRPGSIICMTKRGHITRTRGTL